MVRGNKATFPKCIVYNKPFYKGYRRNPGHGWIEFIDNILFFTRGTGGNPGHCCIKNYKSRFYNSRPRKGSSIKKNLGGAWPMTWTGKSCEGGTLFSNGTVICSVWSCCQKAEWCTVQKRQTSLFHKKNVRIFKLVFIWNADKSFFSPVWHLENRIIPITPCA